jgi:hypothetical protein
MNGASGPRTGYATDLWRCDVGLGAVLSAELGVAAVGGSAPGDATPVLETTTHTRFHDESGRRRADRCECDT